MARSPLFGRLLHSLRLASWLDAHRVSTAEGIERREEHRARRRALLAGAVGALGCATTSA
ncbi:MAG: hypothetical protein IPN17_05585, partial [Deltaproteobacteria bacterium]|nr:hypothetical protein [Deltaproteobacteria bacterium]